MKRIFIYISIFLLSVSTIDAQNIKGRVTATDGAAVSYANIAILNTPIGTIADRDGVFSLAINIPPVQIAVSAVGYATQVVELTDLTEDLDIVLSPLTETLSALIVSANKREEELVRVAASISSLSAQKIEDTRTVSLGNLTALVPNYLYQELGHGFQQIQAIRGIQVFSENPAVATYIDDVNNLDILANGMMLTDIERIEVLRGPQSTLFGRNAMGGVVNIITKKPTNLAEGFAEFGVGNLALQRHAMGLKLPLIKDKLFLGMSGLYQSREGFWINDTTGTGTRNASLMNRTVGGETNLYGNFYLKWIPSARFSATLNLKAQEDKSDETGFFISQTNRARYQANPYRLNLARIGRHERDIVNTALTLKYFGNNFTITSISASQRIGLSFSDIDFPGFYHSFYEKAIGEKLPPQNVISQELRINGTAAEDKLKYTAGLYYFTQVGYEPSTNLAYELNPSAYAIFRNKSDNHGTAFYGELTYAVTPKLSLTGGLRFDSEHRTSIFNGFGDASFFAGQLIQNRPDTTVSGQYNAVSPKVAIAFTPTDRSNIYVSYTRGFRAGGVNAQRVPANTRQTFDPEYSNNYEVGYKMNAANNRLSLGASAFLIQWQNLQFFNLVAPFTYARENVGDAQSTGIELEASAILAKGLDVDASVGLNSTEYKDFSLQRMVAVPIGGNKLSNAPNRTAFIGVQYNTPIRAGFNLILRGEVRHVGTFYTDIQNTIQQDPYTLINAQFGLAYRNYNLSFWGQNLGNVAYLAFGTADTSFGFSARSAAPRTMGVTLKAKF